MIFEKDERQLSVEEFEKLTGAKWIPKLDFTSHEVVIDIQARGAKIHKNGEMTLEQMWFGKYYLKEITSLAAPDVAIRWISPSLGWGVFALRDFKKREFISEYTGKVRKRLKSDEKNAYCFEYIPTHGFSTPFIIDALEQGGLGRYINHSSSPNLISAIATFDHVSHVIFYTKEQIAKGTQLCYDYGPDYWSKRKAPISL